jgi:hypothetical protein
MMNLVIAFAVLFAVALIAFCVACGMCMTMRAAAATKDSGAVPTNSVDQDQELAKVDGLK